MEFELAVAAEAAGAVVRLKPLAASRDGRPRSHAAKAIWHDSPDRALLAQGQTLVESRGQWRLERVYPGAETWLPGTPAPILAEAGDVALLPDLPSPLAPLVAFEGRSSVSVHALAAGSVALTVERGMLRAVTAERPVARIRLSGDQDAVREAALLIAAAVPVTLPLTSLAAEGIALATGWTPPPRRAGSPVLPDSALTVAAALAHIAGHLLDVVLWHATRLDRGPEAVHQMRVAVRRARSAVSLFHPVLVPGVLDPLRNALRLLNARLGATRDWDVFTEETLPAIRAAMVDDERLARLAAGADRRRRMHHQALETWLSDPAFRLLMIEQAWFIASCTWRQPATPPDPAPFLPEAEPTLADFAGAVLQKRWKRLVAAGKGMADLDIPSLHAVRLRAKRARYAAEMFATLYDGKAPQRFIQRLSILQQRLGVLNDGAVATALLAELGGPGGRHGYAAGVVTGFMAARADGLRPRATAAFAKFRRQGPYWS
jgi:CHAD domain-containing protein